MLESHAFFTFGIATVVVEDRHTGRKDLFTVFFPLLIAVFKNFDL